MQRPIVEAHALPAAGHSLTIPRQVTRVIGGLVAWIRHERRIRRSIAELNSLDDHLLADIGLSREHVSYAARFGRLEDDWSEEGGR